jgi:hypothetical protein
MVKIIRTYYYFQLNYSPTTNFFDNKYMCINKLTEGKYKSYCSKSKLLFTIYNYYNDKLIGKNKHYLYDNSGNLYRKVIKLSILATVNTVY